MPAYKVMVIWRNACGLEVALEYGVEPDGAADDGWRPVDSYKALVMETVNAEGTKIGTNWDLLDRPLDSLGSGAGSQNNAPRFATQPPGSRLCSVTSLQNVLKVLNIDGIPSIDSLIEMAQGSARVWDLNLDIRSDGLATGAVKQAFDGILNGYGYEISSRSFSTTATGDLRDAVYNSFNQFMTQGVHT